MSQEALESSGTCQLQTISSTLLAKYFPGILRLGILRLDLPDPISGGNKAFKLKYNFEWLLEQGKTELVTFGGAYSNHIAATAAAGKKYNIATSGIIRGEELNSESNAVLRYAASCGMKLHFVTREEYRKRNDIDYLQQLTHRFREAFILPEGGSNALAVRGCAEILTEQCHEYSEVVCPVGTGATVAGIISSAKRHQHVRAMAVLEGHDYLTNMINEHLRGCTVEGTWELDSGHTLGGYAKETNELLSFMLAMKNELILPLDSTYSGKALFAIHQLALGGNFDSSNVLFVHTGGYGFSQD